jgi:hypothetical protein
MVRAVSFYDWMLALHVLAAFAMAAGIVLFSVLVYSGRRMDTLAEIRTIFRVAPIGTVLLGAGSVLALLLGIVLAIDSDAYQVWDAWIIIAIVLWAAIGGVGGRTGRYYTDIQKLATDQGAEAEVIARLRAPTGARLHLIVIGLFVLLLLDMIFKPWA